MDQKSFNQFAILVLALFVGLDCFIWYQAFASSGSPTPRMSFLDIGQGDSELLVLPGNIKIMTDAGPDQSVVKDMEKLFPGDHYIDLAIVTHPQLDHFNGYNELLKNYNFGAFVINGRNDDPPIPQWFALLDSIKAKHIPMFTLAAADKFVIGSSTVDLLSPGPDFIQSGELNDTGFVEHVRTPRFTALLTADTGFNIEQYLLDHNADVKSDILKVGHHGSKYSSSDAFLAAVNPVAAVIEVGAKNRYGHPNKETLGRLASSTHARVFRTDKDGTVTMFADGGVLKINTEK